MKLLVRQKVWLAVVIAGNLALWLIPSDVVELIAKDRHTLLGRYSRTHFTWIALVAVISVVSFYIDWSAREKYKRRWFQVLATFLVLVPALGLLDFVLRSFDGAHYVRDNPAYHRPANGTFEFQFEDKPEAFCTYPNAPPGFGKVSGVCRTDMRGFRNRFDRDDADIVVLGDSFAEGSNVPDESVWPVHLADHLGRSVTNFGMSGYAPAHYFEALKRYALPLEPRTVLCMLYEGNDFRSSRSIEAQQKVSFSKRMKVYFKQSPIRQALDAMMIRTFGPLNCRHNVPGAEILDWLPLRIPPGPNAKHYAFEPQKLRDLCQDDDAFASGRRWLVARQALERMNQLCQGAGCRFAVIFAPTNAHVLLPLVSDRLSPEKVRAFTAISYKRELPPPEVFLPELLTRIDARERVVARWCEQQSIPFVSLTEPLRAAVERGIQVYYTYNQHWSPRGHEVVARHLADILPGEVDLPEPDADAP
ncbi:MAG: SGNH/GDSL hydrolase family protein [Phycisphaerae bacterium]|jgi:hypothetical protein